MSNSSQYDLATKLILDAMSCNATTALQKAQEAQQIFKQLQAWPEYTQARCLESQLRLRLAAELA